MWSPDISTTYPSPDGSHDGHDGPMDTMAGPRNLVVNLVVIVLIVFFVFTIRTCRVHGITAVHGSHDGHDGPMDTMAGPRRISS